jgi:hypothetical protein
MTVDDAISEGWVHTSEQIYGGEFSRPEQLQTEEAIDIFLLKHDLSSIRPSSKRDVDLTVGTEATRFQGLPWMIKHALTVNRAQRYNYTDLLYGSARFADVENQTSQVLTLIRVAGAEARLYRKNPLGTEYAYQAPLASGTSDNTSSASTKLRRGQRLSEDMIAEGCSYRRVGGHISRRLMEFLESQMSS